MPFDDEERFYDDDDDDLLELAAMAAAFRNNDEAPRALPLPPPLPLTAAAYEAVADHIAPAVLTVTTSHLLGPPTKIPLSADIHLLLDSERHYKSRDGNPSTRTQVSYLLSQLDGGEKTWVFIAEELKNILGRDPILLKLFKDECPGLFAAGTDKYVFSGLDGPLIMRPGYDARHYVLESSLEHGVFYDSKVCSM